MLVYEWKIHFRAHSDEKILTILMISGRDVYRTGTTQTNRVLSGQESLLL